MDFYKRALELNEETITHRRYLHQNAEVGLDLPKTRQYVMDKLRACGIDPRPCGHGVTAVIGSGTPVLLLRADMDALPMPEESGEGFACPTGHRNHACGHDFHAAMLLTAAKMLKENEESLRGTVKLMFQPAEETFEGAQDMISAGILENPHVDAAMAFHVMPGKALPGRIMYGCDGAMMASVDGFRIEIQGKGGHGAYPNLTIDPLRIAVQIYLALESLIAREANPSKMCVLTIGKMHGGDAPNIIPDTAVMEGTLRTNDQKSREMLVRRITEVSEGVAATFGGSVKITSLSCVPPLMCDPALATGMVSYLNELDIPNRRVLSGLKANGSEDFAVIAEKVPSAMIYLSCGFADARGQYFAHNPKVVFNEDVCPIGAAGFAHCASRWLEEHAENA